MRTESTDQHMFNVVVGDPAASLNFYRLLGIVVPQDEETTRGLEHDDSTEEP
jgi:hypothetical protein